jgi:cell division protein FtsZ
MEGLHDSVIDWKRQVWRDDILSIKIIGIGRRGCNAVRSMEPYNTPGIELIVTDENEPKIDKTRESFSTPPTQETHYKKLKTTVFPLKDDYKLIEKIIHEAYLIFFIAYLDEETDITILSILAESKKTIKNTKIAIIVSPAKKKSETDDCSVKNHLGQLTDHFESVIPIEADKILNFYNCTYYNYVLINKIIRMTVIGIYEMVTKVGHIGVDFADLKLIIQRNEIAQVRMGEINFLDNKIENQIDCIMSNNFTLDAKEKQKCYYAVNFTGPEYSMNEFCQFSEIFSIKISQNAEVILSYSTDKSLVNKAILVIFSAGYELA